MICPNCANENENGALFCAVCGKALKEEPIALDLEQIKVPAGARKAHIIKVNATKKEAQPIEEETQTAAPVAEEAVTAEENDAFIALESTESEPRESAAQETGEAPAAPMRKRDWLAVFVLSAIPVVNVIMYFIWAFSSNTNKSKKSYAQLVLIISAVAIVLAAAAAVVIIFFFEDDILSFFTNRLPF